MNRNKKIKNFKASKNFFFVFFFVAVCMTTSPAPTFAEPDLFLSLGELQNQAVPGEDQAKLATVLKESLHSYESLKNYRAIFYKTEESEGTLGPTEEIFLKYEKPWKIYMGWLNTHKKGLQVVYERGKHDGKLAIHKPGLFLGFMQVIFLDQNSPWVKEGSASYNIEDAGIGSFLYDFTKAVIQGAKENKLKVQFNEEKADVTFVDSKKDSSYFAYRVTVQFHPENRLPIQMELFDWENKPMGVYEYRDLKVDLNEDPEFKRQINRHLYGVYNHAD